jgi:phenylalanyl-tRNA synthetase beta chain
MNKKIVGVIGCVHPLMEKKYDVKNVYVAELNLTEILSLKTQKVKFEAIPQYPSVTRDIALVMDKDVASGDVVRTISRSSKRLMSEAKIFDIYEGEHVESGKKSVAISLTFQDPNKTLDEATINSAIENILKEVEKQHGAVLRA